MNKDDFEFFLDLKALLHKHQAYINYSEDLGIFFSTAKTDILATNDYCVNHMSITDLVERYK